jgi:proline dehydrogenase
MAGDPMEELFRTFFLWLSRNAWLRRTVTRFPIAYRIAGRFIAGETVAEAMAAVRDLRAGGMLCTADILGEEVTSESEAIRARDDYLALLEEIRVQGVETDVSLKLTQLGLDLGLDFCVENVGAVVVRAKELGLFVCIDMEDSTRTGRTLEVWRRLYADGEGFDNVGVVIQAYLYRSEADLQALAKAGATVRLCKGAYKEPAEVAFPNKADVDANMVRLMQLMLDKTVAMPEGTRPFLAMATHDEKMIAATRAHVNRLDVPLDAFEFQMLYGIRRDLQEKLAAGAYRMRVYVPFGTEWYPYYMRRMAERPANVWFVLKALFRESPEAGSYLALAALGLMLLVIMLRRRKR